jgi:hypothetical protein
MATVTPAHSEATTGREPVSACNQHDRSPCPALGQIPRVSKNTVSK